MNPTSMAGLAIRAASGSPIAVRPEGWSPTTYAVVSVGSTMLITVILALLKFWPVMKKIGVAADEAIRADLRAEVKELRTMMAEDRLECDRRLDAQQRKMDAITRQFFEAQVQLMMPAKNARATVSARAELQKVLDVIERPIADFMEARSQPAQSPQS